MLGRTGWPCGSTRLYGGGTGLFCGDVRWYCGGTGLYCGVLDLLDVEVTYTVVRVEGD